MRALKKPTAIITLARKCGSLADVRREVDNMAMAERRDLLAWGHR
jgi:hypothetical protein